VQDSSCELLRSLDPASGFVHCCEVPRRTLRSISKGGDVQRRASGLRLSGGARLTENTREVHGCVWVDVEAHRALCCDSHLYVLTRRRVQTA
jgi:hypothetical protein